LGISVFYEIPLPSLDCFESTRGRGGHPRRTGMYPQICVHDRPDNSF